MNDIYESLKAGRSAEDLVAEFTKRLNDAEAQVRAEEEAAKQAELRRAEEAEAAANTRREDLIDVIDCFVSWMKEYYPDLVDDTDLDRKAQGQLADIILMMLEFKGLEIKFIPERKPAKRETPDEIFADFFKSFGL